MVERKRKEKAASPSAPLPDASPLNTGDTQQESKHIERGHTLTKKAAKGSCVDGIPKLVNVVSDKDLYNDDSDDEDEFSEEEEREEDSVMNAEEDIDDERREEAAEIDGAEESIITVEEDSGRKRKFVSRRVAKRQTRLQTYECVLLFPSVLYFLRRF